MSFGITLSATDPVTILAIVNQYVLYTIIFGEILLNDTVSIVMYEYDHVRDSFLHSYQAVVFTISKEHFCSFMGPRSTCHLSSMEQETSFSHSPCPWLLASHSASRCRSFSNTRRSPCTRRKNLARPRCAHTRATFSLMACPCLGSCLFSFVASCSSTMPCLVARNAPPSTSSASSRRSRRTLVYWAVASACIVNSGDPRVAWPLLTCIYVGGLCWRQ
jgi:hypothetical protein